MKSEKPRLKLWYCGITNNEVRRKKEHNRMKGVTHWKCFEANSKIEANLIETFFSNEGTLNQSSIGGAKHNSYKVYVFKITNPKGNFGLNGCPLTAKNLLDYLLE
ncbi:hypothetical protein [Flavobacterium sp.]|uniref:hypothetical protein n=1 Tax=Flavobacterium sp. TaxID=239 RepID=UPI00286E6FC7|nr:hypothetical protein [Flavobacterium sp.]